MCVTWSTHECMCMCMSALCGRLSHLLIFFRDGCNVFSWRGLLSVLQWSRHQPTWLGKRAPRGRWQTWRGESLCLWLVIKGLSLCLWLVIFSVPSSFICPSSNQCVFQVKLNVTVLEIGWVLCWMCVCVCVCCVYTWVHPFVYTCMRACKHHFSHPAIHAFSSPQPVIPTNSLILSPSIYSITSRPTICLSIHPSIPPTNDFSIF